MNNELRHHGIKGQKWGVRNGPPYPLKESKKSNREKRLEKTMNSRIGSVLSEDDKIALATFVATNAAIIAAAVAVPRIRIANERKQHLTENTGKIKQIKTPHSESQDQKAVNKKGYDLRTPEYRANCTMCSTAYELRRRGYDVKANTSIVGRDFKDVSSWFKNTTRKDFTYSRKYSDIKTELLKQPNGARGNIYAGVGMFDSNHSMVWEKKNGKIIIRDCQSDTTYSDIDYSVINKTSRHTYSFIRTDNREINWDTVRDAVVPK